MPIPVALTERIGFVQDVSTAQQGSEFGLHAFCLCRNLACAALHDTRTFLGSHQRIDDLAWLRRRALAGYLHRAAGGQSMQRGMQAALDARRERRDGKWQRQLADMTSSA